ncbi:MAG TPA: M14 family metallopeptidase [Microbacterium sp.]|nr:M14 family metallopeptidase [Microbacterium sp.]
MRKGPGIRRTLGVAAMTCALVGTGVASAQDSRGIDPNQGDSLVEVTLSSKGAAMRLQLEAEQYGVEFNEHYLRRNSNGTVTATVFANEDELDELAAAGYDLGTTIEGPRSWEDRIEARQADVRQEKRADAAALSDVGVQSHQDEIVVLRVDYFENYAGRFLSVEAKNRDGTAANSGSVYIGPEMSLTYNRGGDTAPDSTPRLMNVNIDVDTTPDTYIEHRELVRIGDAGTSDPPAPTRIRIGSSTGATKEAPVNVWLGGGLPPIGDDGYLKDFTTRYMDPTEVYGRFKELAAEFPNIAELITLPNKTNGYQRRAQAFMSGSFPSDATNVPNTRSGQEGAVILTSRAWGHEGGNGISAEFRHPNAPSRALTVTMVDDHLEVMLGTNDQGQLSSTARQVVNAINASSAASQKLVASEFSRLSNANPPLVQGSGIVQPRARVNLSDFLTTSTNAHVPRGPFEYQVMRIGKNRDGSEVGVYLYCQQHAREWATPLTCLETAEQLLRNYAINEQTRDLVNNLDIFILPSSNPDGSHYSIHNFGQQRRNMTNHCVIGGKETDDPSAANFWQPRVNPMTGQPYVHIDPAARNAWGVDMNRNNTSGTIFDGYIGASHSCNSDVYAGPAEASEPEIQNELWIADTFENIKFSNNIHSFGGYFMWAPGAYLPNRGEGDLDHANIGVEKYFFEAGDQILNRIKEHRNTVILPERTGPIADVLYSAAGNSADEHWYVRNTIAYSFETGADRYANTTLSLAAPAGATGIRVGNRNGYDAGDKIRIGFGTANEETATVASVVNPGGQNPPSPNPNVILTAALQRAHAQGEIIQGGTLQSGVGFQPDYATEGKHEALEFTAGNIGLLESAYDYAHDRRAPQVRMTGETRSSQPIDTTFVFGEEPAVIKYTTDGSTPTESSPAWDSTGPREPGEVFHVTTTTTFRWMATDIKGNRSFGQRTFTIVPPKG